MSSGRDLVALADTKIGYRYSTGPTRTTGEDGYFDCSGFIYYLVHALGGPADFPASSSTQAMFCRDHGTLCGQEQARATPGAVAFRGADHGYQGLGPFGHVVLSRGDGITDEAMGRRWGVCHGQFNARGFSNWALLPGFDYSGGVAPLPPTPTEPVRHEGDDKMEIIQVTPTNDANRATRPCAGVDLKEGRLVCQHAIKVKWNSRDAPDAIWEGTKEPYFIDIPIDAPIMGAHTLKETPGETIFAIVFVEPRAQLIGYAHE